MMHHLHTTEIHEWEVFPDARRLAVPGGWLYQTQVGRDANGPLWSAPVFVAEVLSPVRVSRSVPR